MTSSPAPVAIVGATASGKSALAMALARQHLGAEIVSVDSMVVYRGMDIGTSKPTPAERAQVPHHLLDLADPSEEFSVGRFQQMATPVLDDLRARGVPTILVGGTGLYVRSVIDPLSLPGRWPEVAAELEHRAEATGGVSGLHRQLEVLDPVAAGRMLPNNRRRVIRALEVTLASGRPFSSYGPGLGTYAPASVRMLGLRVPREVRAQRIAARVEAQMANGWVAEVRDLLDRAGGLSRTARQALGYREILAHLEQGVALAEVVEQTVSRTRGFAKRQDAWFARDPRVVWLDTDGEDTDKLLSKTLGLLRDW